MDSVLQNIQFAIATGVFLFGIIQLIYRNAGPLNYCMSVAILSLSYILLYFWAIDSGLLLSFPLLFNTDIPVTLFSASGIYLSFTTILTEKESPPPRFALHFVVPAIIFAAFIGFNGMMIYFNGYTVAPEILTRAQNTNLAIFVCGFVSELVFFIYIFLALLKSIRFARNKGITKKAHFVFMCVFLVCVQLISIVFIIIRFVHTRDLAQYFTFVCGVMVILFGMAGFRYPEYTQRVIKTVSGRNKRKENLERLDTDEMMARLISLMEEEKIYKEPELSLKQVSRYMDTTPEIVSLLINRKTRMNYKSFINKYRIEAICRQLTIGEDATILEIAMENGFNSKSTFNTAFQEITGKTPRDFRRDAAEREN